jgi:hypothetical protein
MKSGYIALVLAFGVILLALTYSPAAWARSGQYQGGCGGTVPCRTKVPTPVQIPTKEKGKNTPTPVSSTLPVGITPVVVGSPTAVPILLTDAATITPEPSKALVPTVSIALPAMVVVSATVSSPLPTATRVAPTQSARLSPSDTPVPLPTLTPTRQTAESNGNWLLWVIGLVLIAGGAALVFMRSGGRAG